MTAKNIEIAHLFNYSTFGYNFFLTGYFEHNTAVCMASCNLRLQQVYVYSFTFPSISDTITLAVRTPVATAKLEPLNALKYIYIYIYIYK
jgi:hypothetical protein